MEHMHNQVNNLELTAAMKHHSARLFAWLPQCLEVINVLASRQFGSATGNHPGICWVAVDIEMCDGDASKLHA